MSVFRGAGPEGFADTGPVSMTDESASPPTQHVPKGPTRRPPPVITWAPFGVFLLVMGWATRPGSAPIRDPDAWWHLRMGHEFWSGEWKIWDTGPLSTFATQEWTPRDWIPQLVASRLENWFGLPGVVWLYGASVLVFLVVGYLTCRREADPLASVLALMIAFVAASGSISQRPQMVSFILMFVTVGAWLATGRDLRPRWWLVPLTWVWASSHGMWYCGVVVGLAVTLGLVLDRRVSGRQAVTLAAVPVLGVVAAALTPAGPRVLLTLFDTTGMWQFVTEWAAPSFRELRPMTALVMIFVLVVAWTRSKVPASWVHLGLLTLGVGWILLAARTIPLGVVVLAPLVAGVLQQWTQRERSQPIIKQEVMALSGVLAASLIALAVMAPASGSSPAKVPDGLDAQLEALPPGTPILNEYVLGGWLHWRHPELQTVIDGFTDGYTIEDMEAYATVRDVGAGWEEYITDKDLEVALVVEDSPLALALVDRLGWEAEGSDGGYVLLEAPDAAQGGQPPQDDQES